MTYLTLEFYEGGMWKGLPELPRLNPNQWANLSFKGALKIYKVQCFEDRSVVTLHEPQHFLVFGSPDREETRYVPSGTTELRKGQSYEIEYEDKEKSKMKVKLTHI